MTNTIAVSVEQLWRQGRKVKQNASGWLSSNAPCCADKRGRGGLLILADGSFRFHCFNCQYKTGWAPGALINPKVKRLLFLLGATDQQMSQLAMEALRMKENIPLLSTESKILESFPIQELPKDAKPLAEYLTDVDNDNLFDVCDYILKRRLAIGQYFWSPEMPRRFIIPFEWRGSIVGWTARSIDNIKSARYLSSMAPGYVYRLDGQDPDNEYLLVCEGVLDADVIGACAVLGSSVSDAQRQLIEQTNKKIIWIPDRDSAGIKAAERVIELGWNISTPDWTDCKDINDAVILWGRTAVLLSIMQNVSRTQLDAQLKLKQLSRRITIEGSN